MNDNLCAIKDVGTFKVENVVDARSRTLGFVNPIDDYLGPVAMALDRDLVPLAVVQRQAVESDEAFSASEVETISGRIVLNNN